MANIVVTEASNNVPYNDLLDIDLNNVQITSATGSAITVSSLGLSLTLNGTFYYDAYGYLTSSSSAYAMSLHYNGALIMSATGFSLSYNDIAYGSLDSALQTAFAGNDSYFSAWNGDDFVWTYGGNDRINLGSGNDTLDGGSGSDRLIVDGSYGHASFSSSYGRTILDGPEGRDTLRSIEIVQFSDRTVGLTTGSSSSNLLTGDKRAVTKQDVMLGGLGNDTMRGLSGNDTLFGESGNDRLEGAAGNDQLRGGTGNDTLLGGARNDLLIGETGEDRLEGGHGNDRMLGGGDKDLLLGGSGNDRLFGNSGWDLLIGGTGNDTLSGQGGRDTLIGREGDDLLIGGTQADVFEFHKGHGNDTIADFAAGQDHIQIGHGASRLSQLDFEKQGGDVLVAFADVTILVEDITVSELRDADNFLF